MKKIVKYMLLFCCMFVMQMAWGGNDETVYGAEYIDKWHAAYDDGTYSYYLDSKSEDGTYDYNVKIFRSLKKSVEEYQGGLVIPSEVEWTQDSNGVKKTMKCRVVGFAHQGFSGCSNLTSVTIPSGFTSIGNCAFQDCSSITSVTIPEGVTSIGDYAFGCTWDANGNDIYSSLTNVTIPSSVTSIGNYAFNNCKGLTSVTIPEGVTSIGAHAFWNCSLTSVTIPRSVTRIGSGAFNGCSLTSVTLQEGMTSISIGDIYFTESLTIPSSVTSIMGSISGPNIYYSGPRSQWKIITSNASISNKCKVHCSDDIPGSGTMIDDICFEPSNSYTIDGITITVKSCYGEYGEHDRSAKAEVKNNADYMIYSLHTFFWFKCYDIDGTLLKSIKVWPNKDIIPGESCYAGVDSYGSVSSNFAMPGRTTRVVFDGGEVLFDTTWKKNHTITANDITKTYGAKAFSLNAKSSIGTALTYTVSNPKVATVNGNGKVTIKGCGVTDIKITAEGTSEYKQATKTIKLTVKPKKATMSSVKSAKKKAVTVEWKRDKQASGYIIVCATDSKFKKNKVQVTVSNNKRVSTSVKSLKSGKKYYVRVCAYTKSGKEKVQGAWSKIKTVKIK